ncbi:DUF5067 domain-containing protein [Limosilactobacillus reuteri]|uniref:DUF5067 domain-containing protein n=1 Tax=Limosilactobacillus reuteri TaxID=1598 RepID=A0ABD6XCA5_LIMRT|nr:DUF5067 domain-containing protein [Limosilactobacillus reuteri]MCC4383343.1 DUF5067 domain-containing protein [Limosilactobacillus reuteri]MCC4420180.1 DUF5067 domain-containing protein [Limosilactobacillus reuteri]PTM28380.1 DUF5067 domain-containing protein [Limosilactobacillus reuteri]PTM29919.1 DUF5067 domain-containing protein [Limosilactobacillus reuteri]
MNKKTTLGMITLAALSLGMVAPINTVANASELKTVKPDPNASNRTWTYRNNVFDAGNETYKFTKHKVIKEDGEKYLILYCDVTNNSTKEMEPDLVTMVMDANQKTSSTDETLEVATVGTDENGLAKREHNLYTKILPGKSVHACIEYKLVNNSPVTITFEDADNSVLGTKVIKLK